jgi:hypothetical protein
MRGKKLSSSISFDAEVEQGVDVWR